MSRQPISALIFALGTSLAVPAGSARASVAGAATPVQVPPGRLAFQSYGAPQGLDNVNIWTLDQDLDGFLWVGTADGLFRYDGIRFQGFGLEDGLLSPFVRALCVDGRDRLWIGSSRGLAVREGGRIRPLGEAQGLPSGEVFALNRDSQGRLWVAMDLGLFRQRPGQMRFDPAPGWPAKGLARCLFPTTDSLYVSHQEHLFSYGGSHPDQPVELAGPWKERLDSVIEDHQGRLWVRSRAGLWMRPAPGQPFVDLSQRVGPATYDGNLRLTRTGDLLIATVAGLIRVRGDQWQTIAASSGLPTSWVNRAMEDREGCLWVGGLGLHRDLAHQAWRQYTTQDGISGGVVWSILKAGQDRLLAGTTNGLCEAKNGSWQVVPGTGNQAFLALALAPDGAVWMGGAPARLRRWMPSSGAWLEFPQPTSTITNLAFDRDGVLWIATRRDGLYTVRPKGAGFDLQPFTPPGAVAGERIQSMYRAGDRLWLASTAGLLVQEGGRWRRLGVADGLLSGSLRSVFERGNGELWISYEDRKGISCFAWAQGRLALKEHLDETRGFPARKVYYLREDALGRLWAGTSQGARVLEHGQWHSFTSADGLPGDDCEGAGFLAEPGGDVWLGTLGGLAHYQSARYRGLPKPPPAFVLSAQFGKISTGLPFPALLKVPARDANVEFRFTGLTYLNENLVRHQIRLVGLEDEWRNTDLRQARYTKLPPGSYRFEVRAGFGDGKWGTPAGLAFQVLPAWWQTSWFRILAALAGLGAVGALVRQRMRALEHRNRFLEAQIEARTHSLAEANRALQQLTVTDPLTGLKNRRFLDLTIEEDLAKVNRDYHTIHRGQEDRLAINVDLLFIMADLDHFKHINDTYGHAAGDKVLQQVRDRLLMAVRDTDTVVRWGGEEFLVMARNVERSMAEIVANRIIDLVRSQPFDLGNDTTVSMTVSLGFALYPFLLDAPPESLDWHQVVDLADRCLYAAKESGRNGWVGLLHGGTDASEVPKFLADPESVLSGEGWRLASSFPDPAQLNWHRAISKP